MSDGLIALSAGLIAGTIGCLLSIGAQVLLGRVRGRE